MNLDIHPTTARRPGPVRLGSLLIGMTLTIIGALAGPSAAAPGTKTKCGNGVAEQAEACDKLDLRGTSCQSLGFAGGQLSCKKSCKLDTTACAGVGPRFVDHGDGTIIDNLTGLQWEMKTGDDGVPNPSDPHDVDNEYAFSDPQGCVIVGCPNGTAFTNFLAQLDYCISGDAKTDIDSGYAGHCDWRLPTIQELRGVLVADGGALSLDPIFAPSRVNYASSTTAIISNKLDRQWTISVLTGFLYNPDKTSLNHVRAVRRAF